MGGFGHGPHPAIVQPGHDQDPHILPVLCCLGKRPEDVFAIDGDRQICLTASENLGVYSRVAQGIPAHRPMPDLRNFLGLASGRGNRTVTVTE